MMTKSRTNWGSRWDFRLSGEPLGDPSDGPSRRFHWSQPRRLYDPISAGIAAFSSIAAGTATIATVATAVGFTGMVLGVAGAVTGNSNLAKIGGTLGLIGGVGSLAAGAGMFGTDAAANAGNAGLDTASANDAMDQMFNPATSAADSGVSSSTMAAFGPSSAGPDLSGMTMSSGVPTGAMSLSEGTALASPSALMNASAPGFGAPDGVSGAAGAPNSALPTNAPPAFHAPTGLSNPPITAPTDVAGLIQQAKDKIASGKSEAEVQGWYKQLTPLQQQLVSQQLPGVNLQGGLLGAISSDYNSLSPTGQLVAGQAAAGAVGGLANAYGSYQSNKLQTNINNQNQAELQRQIKNASSVVPVYYQPVAQPSGLLYSGS
ncbi:hypothetical protein GALL_153480 [mine drainage metagenome]|uniref:Uncharacterized protein n=1 Tax=mine drainage metagenome TaxID=410659 RepID=A0A1J5S3G6_9ZZZZ